jgi:phage I-like protein
MSRHESVILLQIDLSGGEPPTEFRLFKAGDNETTHGTFRFTEESATAVMAAFRDHGMDQLPFDFGHGMLSGIGTADTERAAGWFVPEVRLTDTGPELWAVNVQFTPLASQMLRNRELRFFSPAFGRDRDGVIRRLVNIALTNLPATKDQVPLVAKDSPPQGDDKTAQSGTAKDQHMSEKLLGRLSAKDEAEALGVIAGWETTTQELFTATGTTALKDAISAAAAGKVAIAKLAQVSAELETMKAANEAKEKEDLIAKLSEEGKAPPAMHDVLRQMGMAQLKGLAEVLPAATKPATQPAGGNVIRLTSQQKNICKQMMVTEEDYVAQLKAEADEKEAG